MFGDFAYFGGFLAYLIFVCFGICFERLWLLWIVILWCIFCVGDLGFWGFV